MLRAPRPVAEAPAMEVRVEDGREHLQQGLADQPIHRSRHPQHPLTARGLGDHHPPDRLRPVGTRVELRADLRPVVFQPRPELLGAHPVDARGTGVLLDTSERQDEVLAGHEPLPQARLGGVRSGVARRRGRTPLWPSAVGLHPPALPPRPLTGLAAFIVHPTSTGVLRLGFAFGPSRRPSIPPVLRPLLTSPRRAAPSQTPPSHPTRRSAHTHRPGIQEHPWRSPRIRPATFLAHPPRLRDGPLMTTGFAVPSRLAQTAPPSTRFVFLGSRFRLRLPPHPASRRRSCH
jgi:hypothetical protein